MNTEAEDPDQKRSPCGGDAPKEEGYPRKPEVPPDRSFLVREQGYEAVLPTSVPRNVVVRLS